MRFSLAEKSTSVSPWLNTSCSKSTVYAVFQGNLYGGRQFLGIDGRIAILYYCMANLTIYLLKVANLRTAYHDLRYPGTLQRSQVSSPTSNSLTMLYCSERFLKYTLPFFPMQISFTSLQGHCEQALETRSEAALG
jgi:hypothetical protein